MPSMTPCNGCGMTVSEPCHLNNCPMKRVWKKTPRPIIDDYHYEEPQPDWAEAKVEFIFYKIEKEVVFLKLDLSGGCTKKALGLIIKELQQIHREM